MVNRLRGITVTMKKILILVCSAILVLGVAGCVGKGKIPIGKGKAPPVVHTKG